MKSIKYIVACFATLIFTTTAFAQASSLSEREARLIYSRAFEAILWDSPALAILAQVEAGQRDLGAGNTDIIYTSKSMDYRWSGITYNDQSQKRSLL
jgi:hypothetical protein